METVIDIIGTIGLALIIVAGGTYIVCLIYEFLCEPW